MTCSADDRSPVVALCWSYRPSGNRPNTTSCRSSTTSEPRRQKVKRQPFTQAHSASLIPVSCAEVENILYPPVTRQVDLLPPYRGMQFFRVQARLASDTELVCL